MIKSMILRLPRLIIIIIFLTAIFGCTHYYTPKQYPLKPGMVEKLSINQPVTIVNDQPDTENKIIGAQGGNKWLGNLNQWTNTAVRLLKDEFEKRDITVTENSPKVLYLKINDANFYWGFFQIRCILYLTARTGDGYKNEFEGNNASGATIYRAADGAVTRAVAAMLNDHKIRTYLKNPLSIKQEPMLIGESSCQNLDHQEGLYNQAMELFNEKRYDEAIHLLTVPCNDNPTNLKLNILLSKAQLEKCIILKKKGDNSYKTLVKQPYVTGVRLHKQVGAHHELYYIVAKSLFVQDKFQRANKTIKKAILYNPEIADYYVLLGDSCCSIEKREMSKKNEGEYAQFRLFEARDAYKKALELNQSDKEFRLVVDKKLNEVLKKL